ncbi:acrylyl-CoA reductase family protein [Mycetocola reblochoni]|nr:acryloyl-CoA reductase [Mycetocola reblochoni]RLP71280.1 acryloyl-CoA reductase [Mycetocola reblochoni]
MTTFSAWWVEQGQDRTTTTRLRDDMTEAELPEGEVLLDVDYSGINYKDALAMTGAPGILRHWPIVPGIDLVGRVRSSTDPAWTVGSRVVLTGAGLGESRSGGLAERARVPSSPLVAVPDGMGSLDAAGFGTAGVTAVAAVLAIERHGARPSDGPVLVTGAGGGLGGIAVAALAARGWTVVASSGRAATDADYLLSLGAAEVVGREPLAEHGKPLQRERWAAVVDGVGGRTLVNAIAQTRAGGIVTSCGMAGSTELPGTVLPFILRGVHLAGIDSVSLALDVRRRVWDRLSRDVAPEAASAVRRVVPLSGAEDAARLLLDGGVRGRTVIAVGGADR